MSDLWPRKRDRISYDCPECDRRVDRRYDGSVMPHPDHPKSKKHRRQLFVETCRNFSCDFKREGYEYPNSDSMADEFMEVSND